MRQLTLGFLGLALLPVFALGAQPVWPRRVLEANGRMLAAAAPSSARGPVLTVVIEGDGQSHDARGRPTGDPTPRRSIGLDIAREWPGPTAWIGRLCQYVRDQDPRCAERDWTSARYSAEAVAAANAGIDTLKKDAGADQVRLVGWSGGGIIAVLAARERRDVKSVVTFAAPLDLSAWSRRHGLSPLRGSLDPTRLPLGENAAPQLHFIGSLDGNVPPVIAREAARRLGRVEIRRERHDCCWAKYGEEAGLILRDIEKRSRGNIK